ncbi:PAS domain-containing protein [Thermodesulfobacteriota bacterium]
MEDARNTKKQLMDELAEMRQRLTDLEALEAKHKRTEEQYRLLAENATDVIWTRDMNLIPTYLSPSVMKLRGYSVKEAMEQSIDESMTGASAEATKKVMMEELAIEAREQKDLSRISTMEVEMTCKDGSTVWVEVSMRFLHDEDGQPKGILGISRNITERKQVEEDRERLITELQDALADVKMLSGLVPICSSCKKIRNDEGYWERVEKYIGDHFEAEFTHGICPACLKKFYPEYEEAPEGN